MVTERAGRRALRLLVFGLALTPALLLALAAGQGRLGANPVETLLHATGEWALRLLLLTLALTPLRRIGGWGWPLALRRMLGLFAFFYATLHLAVWMLLDRRLAWAGMLEDVLERPFISVGLAAFLLLLPLAATSTRGMLRRLGRHWRRLHRAVYGIAVLGVVHYLWLVKADLAAPLTYGAILALLLVLRWPPLAQWLGRAGAGRWNRKNTAGIARD
jgi:sulfoxide reductase heme-binding subunit YedZ